MNNARLRRLFLLGLIGPATMLAAGAPVFAQSAGPNRSHGPIPQRAPGAAVDRSQLQSLEQRLQTVQQYDQLQELLRQGKFNPREVEALKKALENPDPGKTEEMLRGLLGNAAANQRVPFDPKDPLVEELARQLSQHPDWIRQLEQQASSNLDGQPPQPGGAGPPGSTPPAGNPSGSDAPGAPPPADGSDPGSSLPPPLPPPPASSPPPGQSRPWLARLEKWAANNKMFQDSPALRQTLEELARTRLETGGAGAGPDDNTLGDKMAQWVGDRMPSEAFWKKTVLPKVRDLPVPALPNIDLPNLSFSKPSLPAVDLPAVSLPAPPSNTRAEIVFLSLFTVAVVALVLWKLFGGLLRRKGRFPGLELVGAETDPARLRSLDLWQLTSRADVIRAFETLSLIQLGSTARSWNHLHLAAGLGGDEQGRRRMAEHLASLYEQARYAPGDGPLPAEALRAARRELAILAGVEHV